MSPQNRPSTPCRSVKFATNTAGENQIFAHLSSCSDQFRPALSDRVDLNRYAGKLHSKSNTFEAWDEQELVGLVAAYFDMNDPARSVFVSNVSVLADFRGRGIAKHLMLQCHQDAADRRAFNVTLEVSIQNEAAVALYTKLGYVTSVKDDTTLCAKLILEQG